MLIEKNKYEIDFLKAFAILLIVFYNLNPNFLPGAFIGVDIIFVLIGYLISFSYMRKYFIFLSLIILLPGLIIFNYKKKLWGDCERFIKEQNLISRKNKEEVKPINELIKSYLKNIEFINEYRDSLISSVVTGKIRITEDML